MADCTQKLQATISAAVESWQTGFNSFAYRSARSFFSLADGCSSSTRCDLFNLVPRCQVSRCQVLRFQSPPHIARPLLVISVWEIIGAVNLIFFNEFPLADNFQGWPQIFFMSIHRPHRVLQIRENEIVKVHTNLEIFKPSNFWYFMGPICSTILPKVRSAAVKNKLFLKGF